LRCRSLLKIVLKLMLDTYRDWSENQAPRHAAALAYYTLFSCVPLCLIILSLAGLFMQEQVASQQLTNQIESFMGPAAREFFEGLLQASRNSSHGVLATLFGFVAAAWGGVQLVGQLQFSLNSIWRVRARSDIGWRGSVWSKLQAGFLVLLGSVFLLVAQFFGSVMSALQQLGGGMPLGIFWALADFLTSTLLSSLLFGAVFKVLPAVRLDWKDIAVGAVLTSLLFTLGRLLLTWYMSHGAVASSYGAAATLVLVLLWCNYSAQIVLFGAAFTRQWMLSQGRQAQAAWAGELV